MRNCEASIPYERTILHCVKQGRHSIHRSGLISWRARIAPLAGPGGPVDSTSGPGTGARGPGGPVDSTSGPGTGARGPDS
jgi:hypothetical protein